MGSRTDVQENLTTDSGTDLGIWITSKHGFSLVIADEGGYGSVLLTRAKWEQIKKRVDELLDENGVTRA